jgi:hypothetical protein
VFNTTTNIQFTPELEVYEVLEAYPRPASSFLPKWFKDMPEKLNPSSKDILLEDRVLNSTIKKCAPFLDSLTSGYMFPLPADVQVSQTPEQYRISWSTTFKIAETHSITQVPTLPVPDEYEPMPYKWIGTYAIKTPPGYSVLITHPLNHFDLPFFSFSGVVDTDAYSFSSVSFPFYLRKDFEGIIKKGTPIAQVIPFKRENWKSEIMPYGSDKRVKHATDILKNSIDRAYKKKYWAKKKYQ